MENKGADQIRGYREADLRLCFRMCKKPVFSWRGSDYLWFYNLHFTAEHSPCDASIHHANISVQKWPQIS